LSRANWGGCSARGSWSRPEAAAPDAATVVVVEVRPNTLHAITDRRGFEHDLRMLLAALRRSDGLARADRRAAIRISRRAIAATLN
jgi:hypothetical protein